MKYETTARFLRDYGHLPGQEQSLFMGAVHDMNVAQSRTRSVWPPHWPAHLRIKPLHGVAGVWEMTWSFAGPDGRATFEFVTVEGEPAIRWRRIGGHEIFREP